MAVASTDLVLYLSANRPEDDSSTSGGAMDDNMRLLLRADSDSLNGGSGDTVDFECVARRLRD